MPANIIDGKIISSEIIERIKEEVEIMDVKPGLAAVLVGDNPASQIYVNRKEKKCLECRFNFKKIIFPKEVTEEHLLGAIDELNRDDIIILVSRDSDDDTYSLYKLTRSYSSDFGDDKYIWHDLDDSFSWWNGTHDTFQIALKSVDHKEIYRLDKFSDITELINILDQ